MLLTAPTSFMVEVRMLAIRIKARRMRRAHTLVVLVGSDVVERHADEVGKLCVEARLRG